MGIDTTNPGGQSNFEKIKADLKALKDRAAKNLEDCEEQSQRATNFSRSIRHGERLDQKKLASPLDEVPFSRTKAMTTAPQENIRSGHTGIFNSAMVPIPEKLERAQRQIGILHRDFLFKTLDQDDKDIVDGLSDSSGVKLSMGTKLEKEEVQKIFFAHAKAVTFDEVKAEDYVAAEIYILLRHGREVLNDFLKEIYPPVGKQKDMKSFLLEKKLEFNKGNQYFEEWLTANIITILGKLS